MVEACPMPLYQDRDNRTYASSTAAKQMIYNLLGHPVDHDAHFIALCDKKRNIAEYVGDCINKCII